VDEVVVHGPRGLGGGRDGDVVLSSELQKVGTTLEALDELRHTPGGDDLKLGVASLEGQLEANLAGGLLAGAIVTSSM